MKQEMVFVPAGEFLMGHPEPYLGSGEGHHSFRHTATTGAFWIDKYEVTNAMFKEFMDATGYHEEEGRTAFGKLLRHWKDGMYPEGTANHPVRYVTYEDACAYASWAGKRLPSNEEWDKAGRGTDGRETPWGGSEWKREGRAAHVGLDISGEELFAVDALPSGASPYGALHMEGNIWEWTTGRVDTHEHWKYEQIVRGGLGRFLNVRVRPHDHSEADLGFRCVRDATPAEVDSPR